MSKVERFNLCLIDSIKCTLASGNKKRLRVKASQNFKYVFALKISAIGK